jgi:hypothetical protein
MKPSQQPSSAVGKEALPLEEIILTHWQLCMIRRRVPSFGLFSLYSQPAFYTGYIVYAASLLIATSKGLFGQ